MKFEKTNSHKVEIPKAFRDALIDLAEHLIEYYKQEIPLWDLEEQRNLNGYKPSQSEIEHFPVQLHGTYLTLKWTLFHPATWLFSKEKMIAVIHNPLFFTYDHIFQLLFPSPELKKTQEILRNPSDTTHNEIIERHKLAVTSFRGLFYLNEKYFDRLGKEVYGEKIIENFIYPTKLFNGRHPLTILAEWVRKANRTMSNAVDSSDGIFQKEAYDNQSQESFSIIYESIWNFIQKRYSEIGSLNDYVSPELQEGPIKDLYMKAVSLIEDEDQKVIFLQRDAVRGIFRTLNLEAYNRLVDQYRTKKAIYLPKYIRSHLKQKFLGLNPGVPFNEKDFQNFLRDETQNFSIQYDMNGDVKITDQEKYHRKTEERDIEEPEDLLGRIQKNLTARQKKIIEAYRKEFNKDSFKKPTQETIAKKLNIDRKTLHKDLDLIKSYLKNTPE